MGGTIVQAIVAIVAGFYLARVLGPEIYGQFATAFAITGLALSLLTLRLNTLIFRARDDELDFSRRQLYLTAMTVESVVVGAITLASLGWFGLLGPWEVSLVLSQCGLHWVGMNKAFYERSMPYARLAVAETATIVASHVFAVGLAALGFGAGTLYMREIFAVTAQLAALWLIGGLRLYQLRLPQRAECLRLLREARSVWLEGVIDGSFQRIATLTANWLGDHRQVGLFFMAQSLAMKPNQLLSGATSRVAVNWFRHIDDPVERRRSRNRVLIMAIAPLSLAGILTFALSDSVIPLLLGPQWNEAAACLAAMSAVVVFQNPFEILRGYGMITRRTRLVLFARIVQYAGFAGAVLVGLIADFPVVVTLGLAVSAAYASAFVVLWLSFLLTEWQVWRPSSRAL
jgi:O-antigen/teichoic acid export membrane protein